MKSFCLAAMCLTLGTAAASADGVPAARSSCITSLPPASERVGYWRYRIVAGKRCWHGSAAGKRRIARSRYIARAQARTDDAPLPQRQLATIRPPQEPPQQPPPPASPVEVTDEGVEIITDWQHFNRIDAAAAAAFQQRWRLMFDNLETWNRK